jgi:hypothetical protein
MLERVQTAFSEHSMGSSSYAGAMATALVVGLAAIGVLLPGSVESTGDRVMASTAQKSSASRCFRSRRLLPRLLIWADILSRRSPAVPTQNSDPAT